MYHRNIVIVGGGPVAYVTALHMSLQCDEVIILAEENWSLALNSRILSLSYASYYYLLSLGIAIDKYASVSMIDKVHLSYEGFGSSLIMATDVGLPHLGFTIKYADLMQILTEAIKKDNIKKYNCKVTEVFSAANYALIKYVSLNNTTVTPANIKGVEQQKEELLTANLAIIAAGNKVKVHNIEYSQFHYNHFAVTMGVKTEKEVATTAYERFNDDGAFVMLPYKEQFILIWSLPNTKQQLKQEVQQQKKEEIKKYLAQYRFFSRFGNFEILSDIYAFPLLKMVAKTKELKSVYIIGSSAQTLHPILAQNLNVGFRDARALGENVYQLSKKKKFFTTLRRDDTKYIENITHYLARFMETASPVTRHLQGLGIITLGNFKPLQKKIINSLIFGI